MGKIEDKKRQKKEALLTSAYQLFTKKGIDNTSVAEIVKNAKMAKGTFYLYFTDKYQMRDILVANQANRIFEKANASLEKKQTGSLEECILYLVNNIIDQLSKNPTLLGFIAKNLSWGIFSNIQISEFDNKNCMDIFDSLLLESKRIFRQKELMIYMIVELVNSTCYNVILHNEPVPIVKLKEELGVTITNIMHQFEMVT